MRSPGAVRAGEGWAAVGGYHGGRSSAERPSPGEEDGALSQAGSEAEAQPLERTRLGWGVLGGLGVVFGDIGTSPLYALRICFGEGGLAATEENVFGVLSLILWSLLFVISLKYITLLLRADLRGEGGILALMTLATRHRGRRSRAFWLSIGLFGAALLYGDGMITPAISVLSAVEGLGIAQPALAPAVIPLAVAILIGVFALQRQGTQAMGSYFGPIMVLWFAAIALLGAAAIVDAPGVLRAASPHYALRLLISHGSESLVILGAVFLVVTGGEALYADLGHFGAKAIRVGWFAIVLPALLINYYGQGALLLQHPDSIDHVFYDLAPGIAQLPLVVLATIATIIASQAVISGAFSLTWQSLQLGYSPPTAVLHTSARGEGQVFVPLVNRALMLASIGLVVGFGSSQALAGAYGVAVSTTMLLTTLLGFALLRRIGWGWPAAALASAPFLAVDGSFFAANLMKIAQGGWFPLMVGGAVYLIFTTWRQGQKLVAAGQREHRKSQDEFIRSVGEEAPVRVPGWGVFVTRQSEGVPEALVRNLMHNHVLHERVSVLSVTIEEVPRVSESERVEVIEIADGFAQIRAHYGYMQTPNLPYLLDQLEPPFDYDPSSTTFFLARESVVVGERRQMMRWRKHLYAYLLRNSEDEAVHFQLPTRRVIEIRIRVAI